MLTTKGRTILISDRNERHKAEEESNRQVQVTRRTPAIPVP